MFKTSYKTKLKGKYGTKLELDFLRQDLLSEDVLRSERNIIHKVCRDYL